MSQIDTWVADSRQKLAEAEAVCDATNRYITLTTTKLEQSDEKLPKLVYYMDSSRQQLRLLGIIRDSLDMSMKEVKQRNKATSAKVDGELVQLDKVTAKLKEVKVDSSFNGDERSLFYYVSEQDLANLLSNVTDITKQLDKLMKNSRTDALLIRFGFDLDSLNNEFHALETHYKEHARLNRDGGKDPIGRLLGINEDLELDMVSILDSFNKHYDQCIKGSQLLADPSISEDDKQDLKQVLDEDVQELPRALASLQNDKDTIIKNCKEIIKMIGIFQTFYDRVGEFIKQLAEYGETSLQKQLHEFNAMIGELDSYLVDLAGLSDTVNDYREDFSRFIEAYYSLVLEVNRRAECDRKLEQLVNKFKLSLSEVINEEYDKRLEFLQMYGDFLPQNLVDPKLVNAQPPTVEINMATDSLPDLNKQSVAAALKNIE